jgi:hypothetical protein
VRADGTGRTACHWGSRAAKRDRWRAPGSDVWDALTRRAHVPVYPDVPVADIGRTIGSKLGDYCPDLSGQSSIGPTYWSTIGPVREG